jgi:aryl-alcohol dehydrogenase-like predicted oxidoreductase
MIQCPLGNTGMDVSAMCFGTMRLGTREDRQKSYALLDQYAQAGGSFLDTANIYAHWQPGGAGGDSEKLLGSWMAERSNRDEIFLASKVGFGYPGVDGGLRASQIKDECEKSLRRLGTDRIDLYYAHCDDPATPLNETMKAFNELLAEGKIRAIGASNYTAWRLAEANCVCRTNEWDGFVCLQQRYTYLWPKRLADFSPQKAVTGSLLEYCHQRKVTLLAYSPLLGGAYTRQDRRIGENYGHVGSDQRLEVLGKIAAEREITRNQLILAWMLNSRPMVIPVFSASTSEQMAENLGALEIDLSDEEMIRLNQAGV